MSQAAEEWAQAFTHPEVTPVARDILDAIARLIPEGETTTPLIAMGAIATSAHVDRRTVWTWIPVLVAIGVMRLVDGGHGRKARYTLVHVDGAPPIAAVPLPLRADLQAVRPRPLAATPLFDEPPIGRSESEELVIPITSWAARSITRITSWAVATITRITSYTSTAPSVRSDGEELVIGTCDPCDRERSESEELVIRTCDPCDPTCDPPLPLDVDDARARGTYNNLRTTTTTAAASAETPTEHKPKRPPCRWHGTVHAWCDGRVHVPMDFHKEEWRKLARSPGQTDEDLDEQLFAEYAAILAAIPETERIRDKTEFAFWNRLMRSPRTVTPPRAGPVPIAGPPLAEDPPYDAVWRQIRSRIERKVSRHVFHTWFVPLVMVTDTGPLIEVTRQGSDSSLFADWIQKHYADILRAAVDEVRPGARVDVIDVSTTAREADRKFG